MIKYIEPKTGYADNGLAWIARVVLSRSGQAIWFGDGPLRRGGGQLVAGDFIDIISGDEYWLSGVKKRGGDRLRARAGRIAIEASAVPEYLAEVGSAVLPSNLHVIEDLPAPGPASFAAFEDAPRDS
jgi:hypothetical protein